MWPAHFLADSLQALGDLDRSVAVKGKRYHNMTLWWMLLTPQNDDIHGKYIWKKKIPVSSCTIPLLSHGFLKTNQKIVGGRAAYSP